MPRQPIDPDSPTVKTSVRITEAHQEALDRYADEHGLPSRNAALCAVLDKIAKRYLKARR